MKNIEDKHIEFVAKHYEQGKLDTQKALAKFKRDKGIRPTKRNPFLRWSAVAASVAIGAFVLTRIVLSPQSEWVNLSAESEKLIAYLPDSTKVVLAEGSTLSYDAADYGKDGRHVNMSGEVFFKVTRNEQSPFEVTAKTSKVEVLGTQFLVDENDDNTELYVESGKVRFSAMDDSSSEVLTKGMSAELGSDNIVAVVDNTTSNPAAWATGKFVYENTPISEVLKELSTFYDVTLTTTNNSKALTASFSTDNLEEIITIIESVLNVKIERR